MLRTVLLNLCVVARMEPLAAKSGFVAKLSGIAPQSGFVTRLSRIAPQAAPSGLRPHLCVSFGLTYLRSLLPSVRYRTFTRSVAMSFHHQCIGVRRLVAAWLRSQRRVAALYILQM